MASVGPSLVTATVKVTVSPGRAASSSTKTWTERSTSGAASKPSVSALLVRSSSTRLVAVAEAEAVTGSSVSARSVSASCVLAPTASPEGAVQVPVVAS